MNLTLYKPTDLEEWINHHYRRGELFHPSDLEIGSIASLFDTHVTTTRGRSTVTYEDDFWVIFIQSGLDEAQKREVFFHELCHPVMHFGDQRDMPKSLKDMQEEQAAHFQLYASMPIYMFEEYRDLDYGLMVRSVSEDFRLPIALVKKRVDQIQRRIHAVVLNESLLEGIRLQEAKKKQDSIKRSPQTRQIIQKLFQQLYANKHKAERAASD
jgi:Zn-dependent peptidase ImmA (M78 family)